MAGAAACPRTRAIEERPDGELRCRPLGDLLEEVQRHIEVTQAPVCDVVAHGHERDATHAAFVRSGLGQCRVISRMQARSDDGGGLAEVVRQKLGQRRLDLTTPLLELE